MKYQGFLKFNEIFIIDLLQIKRALLALPFLSVIAAVPRFLDNCSILFLVSFSFFLKNVISDLEKGLHIRGKFFKFFFIYFLCILHWVYVPLTLESDTMWMIPFAVIILPMYLAFYMYICGAIIERLYKKSRSIIPLFSIVISLSEYAYSNLLTGFPWTVTGYIWADNVIMMQIISIIGVHGLGLLTIISCLFIGISLDKYKSKSFIHKKYFAFGILIIAIIFVFGVIRLKFSNISCSNTTIKFVQGSIEQNIKNDYKESLSNFNIYKELSRGDHVDIIIWPEASIPWDYSNSSSPVIKKYLAEVLNECDFFISGAVRKEHERYYNSLIMINKHADDFIYDKVHLLPFGEYIPFRKFLTLKSISMKISDFSRGNSGEVVDIKCIQKFSPHICYESIFPEELLNRRGDSTWMINITNDGWFKRSVEAKQHHYISRARAIENGMPLVRVNNYGYSSIFDSYGRMLYCLNPSIRAAIKCKLPKKISNPIYSKYKNSIYFVLITLLFIFLFINGKLF